MVDSSLKDQEMMVVRFSKNVQKKKKTKKKKEKGKKPTKNKETRKQTNKKREKLVKRITSLAEKRLEMV